MKRLKTGVAYHGNRMLSHVLTDLDKIVEADMDIVVHMFSHNDWERHDTVMRDIFNATEDKGLEVWVDNWGIGGSPGDKCHFLGAHPEAHTYYGDGLMHPYQICLNSPAYRQFVRDWADKVAELGGKTVFWDEPEIPTVKINGTEDYYASCTCPNCRKLFEERYGKPMPAIMDADVAAFRNDTMVEFHEFASSYAASLGMKNVICFMPHQLTGLKKMSPIEELMSLDISRVCNIKDIDNIGTDPYWFNHPDPYQYVYDATKACVDIADKYEKDHNLWIQSYAHANGREEGIVEAFEAAYDGGARTVITWSYMGGEPNSYHSVNPLKAWVKTAIGSRRIKEMDRDRVLAENRAKFKK